MIDKWLNCNEIAELLSRSIRRIRGKAKEGNWPYRCHSVRGGKERRYHLKHLPEDIQIAYAASIKVSLADLQSQLKPSSNSEKKINIPRYSGRGAKTRPVKDYDKLPEKYRQVADLRRKVIETYSASGLPVKHFVQAFNSGVIGADLRTKLDRHGDITSESSLYRWLGQYQQDGIEGLAPQYQGKGPGASLTQEIKDRLEWLYLDTSQPSITVAWELLEQYGLKTSEATARRYINALPQWLKDKLRKGKGYFKGNYLSYINRDYTLFKPMEVICGDYMTQDFMCRKGKKVLRARLCAFMDMRSRTIVGWSLQETANSIGVIRSLQIAFTKYGLPEKVLVDNGKEFKNYLLCGDKWKVQKTKVDPELLDMDVGILAECGVEVAFCTPYHAQAKPIERFWRTMHERFDKFIPTYGGSNTASRPDEVKELRGNIADMKKYDLSLIPAFEEIEKRIGNFINWYNEKWAHSGQGMENRTPLEVFNKYAETKREIPEHLKKYVFTMRYIKSVQRNGVKLDGIYYQHKDFINHNGKKVEVRRSLDNSGVVHIFSIPDRVYLFDAEEFAYSGVVAEDIQKKKRLHKDMKNLEKKYNRKKEEYESGVFKTPAETYAETYAMEALKVVGGDPITEGVEQKLEIVKSGKPIAPQPKALPKKYIGLLDV